MESPAFQIDGFRLPSLRPHAAMAISVALVIVAQAAPPLVPLPAPYYSFDLASPTVEAGIVGAADILAYGDPYPVIVLPGFDLGLLSPYDDLDALSFHHAGPPTVSVSLLFSVDRATVGVAPPDPVLVGAGVPFNVQDQALRQQAAGDEYMSLNVFPLGFGAAAGGTRANNNVLVRNNFDEGGTSYNAQPPTSAQSNNSGGAPQDNVDASAAAPAAADGTTLVNLYFSLTRNSPSLHTLPGYQFASGANIYFNANPQHGTPTELYAAFYQLGLVPQDDVRSLAVFESGRQLGVFDDGDFLLFTLAPGSPSLFTIPGHSPEGAGADVFIVRYGVPPMVFAPAASFGLGNPTDGIDALDFFLCDDGYACAVQHGIRDNRGSGDTNCDGFVDFDDINAFVLALSDPALYGSVYPLCDLYNADCNCDGIVDFDDINPFVAVLSGLPPCQ